ncbi:RNI-like protein [Suillus clintonianus]|uniref:RNI-like protein n=1 Tax=Suillus clintonianus TaxID=1904413 RepID=UPI001B87AC4B|nr:RNI-like protein [Suillus clintonianus]KAG2129956.1 RNI-like protein [Suillus clintonianus]
MSKRKAEPSRRVAKRRRGGVPAFGAENEDDQVNLASGISTASAFSTRSLLSTGSIPNLSALCARSFVANLQALHETRDDWENTFKWLKLMPDNLVPKLFAMLRSSCPQILTNTMIIDYFLRGPSIVLTSDIPVINRITFLEVAYAGNSLHELHLTGFAKFADSVFAAILPSVPSLKVLVLRGCAKVGSATAEAAARSCHLLSTVNFNYTTVPPVALVPLLKACSDLKVLKLAGIPNWTDATFAKLSSAVFQDDSFMLRNMSTLKLRQLGLSESSIYSFLARCPNLTRLDLSFTHVHRPLPVVLAEARIEKLSLTSTAICSTDVVALISSLPHLKSLALGALGGGQGSSVAIGNTSAMTMTDQTLDSLTDVLKDFGQLEKISLVGNTKLGVASRGGGAALEYFIRCVGRKCKYLNLSGVHHLQSRHLAGLFPQDDENQPPRLEQLILNNTGVDDEAAPYLACCSNLVALELAGTKISSAGLFSVVDNCPKLQTLNLTSCRGVSVTIRRRFFEAWEDNSAETR